MSQRRCCASGEVQSVLFFSLKWWERRLCRSNMARMSCFLHQPMAVSMSVIVSLSIVPSGLKSCSSPTGILMWSNPQAASCSTSRSVKILARSSPRAPVCDTQWAMFTPRFISNLVFAGCAVLPLPPAMAAAAGHKAAIRAADRVTSNEMALFFMACFLGCYATREYTKIRGLRETGSAFFRLLCFTPGMVSEMQLFLSVFAAWGKARFHAGLEGAKN